MLGLLYYAGLTLQVNLPMGHFEADNGASSGLISAATRYFNSEDVCVRCKALAIGWLEDDVTMTGDGAEKVLRFLQLIINPFSV